MWNYSKMKVGELNMEKVLGTNKSADAMREAADRWTQAKCMAAMHHTVMSGRADSESRADLQGHGYFGQ